MNPLYQNDANFQLNQILTRANTLRNGFHPFPRHIALLNTIERLKELDISSLTQEDRTIRANALGEARKELAQICNANEQIAQNVAEEKFFNRINRS